MSDYHTITIDLPEDYEGSAVAKLFELKSGHPSTRAVLYLHGYVDYFFQDHMARFFTAAGYHFYALELRRCGRSLLPGQHPFYIRRLEEYYPEIDRAIGIIREAGTTFIGLVGHSTGGLLAALYADNGRLGDRIDRLILNSPFLEFNTTYLKKAVISFAGWIARVAPYANIRSKLPSLYAESIHKSMRGEWDYDLSIKSRAAVPLYFAWIDAVRQGHKRIRKGLKIEIPVLVMHSDNSVRGETWSEAFRTGDAVLDVKHIRRYAPRLGTNVSKAEIEGGLHDLVLSRPAVREKVLLTMVRFLDRLPEEAKSTR